MYQRIPPRTEPPNGGAASSYDFAIFIAKSLGRSLPVIVVIALVAYGAFYGIRVAADLQTKLNEAQTQEKDAEIKKAQAEADAKDAGEKAQLLASQEYSKQLTNLNEVSEDVSKRLQELVSKQLENMETDNKLRVELQDQIEQQSKAQLQALRDQIDGANASLRTASVSAYDEIKNMIARSISRESYVSPGEVDLLDAKLENPQVKAQAVADAASDGEPWGTRVLLNLRLFLKTSETRYVDSAFKIASQNKAAADQAAAQFFVDAASDKKQGAAVLRGIADLIIDEGYRKEFRDQLWTFGIMENQAFGIGALVSGDVNKDLLTKVTNAVGIRLIQTVRSGDIDACSATSQVLEVLRRFSADAELVYATQALQKLDAADDRTKECIRPALEKSIDGRTPSPAQMQQWTVR
jgi:hypothetical protein